MRWDRLASWFQPKPFEAPPAFERLEGDAANEELAELADLFRNGDPDDPKMVRRIAQLRRMDQP
jgi:hypothetical protein